MMEKFPTIIIPEKNDFIYCLTIPSDVSLANATDVHVYISTTPKRTIEAGYTITGNKIKIPMHDLALGKYNIWATFKVSGQRISFNYNAAFHIVAWNNQYINWEDYKEGSTLAVATGACLLVSFSAQDFEYLWNTMEAFESLKEECEAAAEEAHDAAEYAKQEGDKANEIYKQVKDAYESGDLKGEKGDDGHTPVKGVDYFDGEDGHTPVKGVDYFDGEDGKDGKDGGMIWPQFIPDAKAGTLTISNDSNRITIEDGYLCIDDD